MPCMLQAIDAVASVDAIERALRRGGRDHCR
jgi:hypothetical protein